jgi:hypothetical protein
MKPPLGLLTWGGVLAALALAVAYQACKVWPGVAWPGGANSIRRIVDEQRRADKLEVQLANVVRRGARRRETVQELIAGRRTLREAAARSQALAREDPDFPWDMFRREYPGRTDEERHCRQMIVFVQTALQDHPGEAAEVVARLEAELEAYREPDGTIRLPPERP